MYKNTTLNQSLKANVLKIAKSLTSLSGEQHPVNARLFGNKEVNLGFISSL